MFKKYLKRHLTIKTKFNPNNPDDVQAFDMFGEYVEENGGEIRLQSETMLDIKFDNGRLESSINGWTAALAVE